MSGTLEAKQFDLPGYRITPHAEQFRGIDNLTVTLLSRQRFPVGVRVDNFGVFDQAARHA